MQPFSTHFFKLIEGLSERSRHIVSERFGLLDGKAKTLEEIGKSYRITRERVRQIVRSSLKDLGSREKKRLAEVSSLLEIALSAKHGIASKEDLIRLFGSDQPKEESSLLFFLEYAPALSLRRMKESARMKESYVLRDFDEKSWRESADAIKSILEQSGEVLSKKKLFEQYVQAHPSGLDKETLFDFLAVSREVSLNAFGKYGLTFWKDVTPKGTRERAHLVLKSLRKPLHFREIARLIDEYGLSKKSFSGKFKKTHPQTVHNELIKDSRFVLVGRGIYALAVWGYAKGTVREVIAEVLKKNGGTLRRDELVEKTLALRKVKRSTIIINLNTFFAKVGKDAYTLR